jgi:hypothetical protein
MEGALGRDTWSTAAMFQPKDDDDLNRDLCAGRFRSVIFADLDSLLEMLWKDELDLERWQTAGARIDVVTPPIGPPEGWRELVREVQASLVRWKRRQRKRQIIAALILNAIALLAMAAIFGLIPLAR